MKRWEWWLGIAAVCGTMLASGIMVQSNVRMSIREAERAAAYRYHYREAKKEKPGPVQNFQVRVAPMDVFHEEPRQYAADSHEAARRAEVDAIAKALDSL